MVIAISHVTDRSTAVHFSDRVMLSIGCVCACMCVCDCSDNTSEDNDLYVDIWLGGSS